MPTYQNEGPDGERYYVESIKSIIFPFLKKQGLNEEEFIENAREFVSQPGAEAHVRESAEKVFEIIDANKDVVISRDEYTQFYRAGNASEQLIDRGFKASDTNGDGFIDRSELQEYYVNFFFSESFSIQTN